MTLGEGIFFSTALLVLAAGIYQISLRHKWKLVAKAVGAFALIAAVTAGGFWLWDKRQEQLIPVQEFAGVRLGMTPVEVTLSLGEPTREITGGETETFSRMYLYVEAPDTLATYTTFSKEAQPRLEVACRLKRDFATEVLGIGWFTTEGEIVQRFGAPSGISVNKQGIAKLITYDPLDVAFEIEKGKISRLCITSKPVLRYMSEYEAGADQILSD